MSILKEPWQRLIWAIFVLSFLFPFVFIALLITSFVKLCRCFGSIKISYFLLEWGVDFEVFKEMYSIQDISKWIETGD